MNEEKRERKRRIKAQNAERKNDNPLYRPREELTLEQQAAIRHIAIGLMELFAASVLKRFAVDEFPAELEVKEAEQ